MTIHSITSEITPVTALNQALDALDNMKDVIVLYRTKDDTYKAVSSQLSIECLCVFRAFLDQTLFNEVGLSRDE